MSLNSNKTLTGSKCMTVISTLAQDDFDKIHVDYINSVLNEGGKTFGTVMRNDKI